MVILWISAIVFVIAALLFCPLSLSIKSNESIQYKLSYLFFSYKYDSNDISENKAEKNDIASQNSANKTDEDRASTFKKIRKITKKYTAKQFCGIVKIAYNHVKADFARITKNLKIKKFDIYIGIAGEDAADTANKTALVSSIAYPFFSLAVNNIASLKNYYFKIEPLFLERKNRYYSDIKIKIPFICFVLPSLKIFLYLSKLIRRL